MTILPNDPRAFLGGDALSFSELSTLARCENAWALSYGQPDRERVAPSAAMQLGTDIHSLWGQWWTSVDVDWDVWFDTSTTAGWVMDRYAQYYGHERAEGLIKFRAAEMPLAAQLPWGPWFFGFADGLVDVPALGEGLWVIELKSTANFNTVLSLTQSAQTPLYVWALRQMGYPVVGAMLDVVSTAGRDRIETKADAYKRLRAEGISTAEAKERSATERLTLESPPLAESFQRHWLRFSDDQLDQAVAQAHRAVETRMDLTIGRSTPLRNVGPSCSGCFAVAPCFGLAVEIVDEDPWDAFDVSGSTETEGTLTR